VIRARLQGQAKVGGEGSATSSSRAYPSSPQRLRPKLRSRREG
jgi:hypothetical protein